MVFDPTGQVECKGAHRTCGCLHSHDNGADSVVLLYYRLENTQGGSDLQGLLAP